MSQINILFYSNNCEASKMLISLMQGENLVRFFHLFCTDNNPKVPAFITRTPTLMIRNVPTPYVASDAFVWFSKIKQWKINTMLQEVSSAQQKYLQNVNSNLVSDNSNILGFSSMEMNAMSDIFSFFSKDQKNECQEAFPQSFVTCDAVGQDKIFTPPLEDGKFKVNSDGKYKISATKHKELQESLKNEREKQDKIFDQHIKNFQNTMVSNKKN